MNVGVERFYVLCYIIFERILSIMDKNYYDILQVNKNASPEIIEKAYKILAKKYHPDLQTEENKKQSEEILKEINEAYEILSNPEKRKNYDTLLLEHSQNSNDVNYSPNENNSTTYAQKQSLYQQELLRQQQEKQYQEQLKQEQELAYRRQVEQARQQAYYDAYIQDLKNRGYKIRYKKSLKDYIKGFISILLVVLVLFIIFQIPFVKNYFINLYEQNDLVHGFVTFFCKIFRISI